jgi:hypothetical protein
MIVRLLGNLALALGAVLFTLVAGEIAARFLFPEWVPEMAERSFWRYDERLGWAHAPGQSGVHRQPDFAVEVEISSQGLRDREYLVEPPDAAKRILVLGDSFAWGQGVAREHLWHEIIEARNDGWELINSGVAGYGTGQQLIYLEEQGLEFQPRFILLMLHPNDLLDDIEPFRYGYFKPTWVLDDAGELELTQVPVPRLDFEQRFDRWLRNHTYLLYRVYHAQQFFDAWREERAKAPEAPRAEKSEKPRKSEKQQEAKNNRSPEERAARKAKREARRREAAERPQPRSKYAVDVSLTIALLERMREAAEAGGARLLIATVPMPDPPRGLLAEAVQSMGIPLLMLDEAFAAASGETRFRHDPHWTPYGHEVAAGAVEAFLREQGMLTGQAPRALDPLGQLRFRGARVAELADAGDLKSPGFGRAGSSPAPGTTPGPGR